MNPSYMIGAAGFAFGVAVGAGGAITLTPKATAPTETIHDVAYYLAHPDELKAGSVRCENNPGELAETATCVNIGQARLKQFNAVNPDPPRGQPIKGGF